MKDGLKFFWQPELESPTLVVGWTVDAGGLGAKVVDYLNRKLGGKSLAEIDPVGFFPLGGVTIENDLVQFPESKFYAYPGKNLLVFISDPPSQEWYQFLNLILDAAEHYQVKEVCTIGGMVSLSAHTAPRELMGAFSSPEVKEALSQYQLAGGLNYETPPGQRPTLSSFLLWATRKRTIPGFSLWVPIPFYLLVADDPMAEKETLGFLDRRLDLGIDFTELDDRIRQQDQLISQIRRDFPDIDQAMSKLEANLGLSEEENQRLVEVVGKFLAEKKR